MIKFKNSEIVKDLVEVISIMYEKGWDEKNGGNVSYLLNDDEVNKYNKSFTGDIIYDLNLNLSALNNRYLLLTRTGIYFKNISKNVSESFGVIKILNNGEKYKVVWGFQNDGEPTSEMQSHLLGHEVNQKSKNNNRVIMHSHPTNLIAMSFLHELEEKSFTKTLWKMMTECLIVFPEGIGILPWMVCGNGPIGTKTAEKLNEVRVVLWPMHGVFSTGADLDDAFGLLETIEKAAEIYIKTTNQERINMITDTELIALAKSFNVTPKANYLGEDN